MFDLQCIYQQILRMAGFSLYLYDMYYIYKPYVYMYV